MLCVIGDEFRHNARELWQFYGAPGEFRTWFHQVARAHHLREGEDYLLKKIDRQSRYGQPRKEVFLKEEALRRIQLGYGKPKHEVQAAVAHKSVEIDELLRNPRLLAQIFLDYADARDKLDILHHSDCMISGQEIAKDLGFESAKSLYQALIERGVMYRGKGGRSLPCANKIPPECYAIKVKSASDGQVINCLRWTMQGKGWIAQILGKLP